MLWPRFDPVAGGVQNGFDRLPVEPPGSRLVAQLARGARGVEAIPVRPWLAQRLIDVRRRQHPAAV